MLRKIAIAVPCLIALLAGPVPIQAQTPAQQPVPEQEQAQVPQPDPGRARASLHTSITRILDLLKNPNYTNPATRPVVRSQIEDEVYHIFDFAAFSAHTLGSAWQGFSEPQRQAFTTAFANLLFSTYLSRIDGYNGEKVQIVGEVRNRAGTRVEIRTKIAMADGRVIPVDYRMVARGRDYMVYDVLVEGISLDSNYRAQFHSILQKSTPDELIARVQEKAAEEGKGHD